MPTGRETATSCSPRSRRFSPASRARRTPTACWRPCCSPTSSVRRSWPPSSATSVGLRCSETTTGSCVRSSRGSADTRSTPRATGSWRRSTVRPGRSAARRRSGMRCSALGLEIRAGLHTGEVETRGEAVMGIAVHIGARVQASAEPGEILVSRTVVDLVAGSGIAFLDRGRHVLKGVDGRWQLFAVDTDALAD